MRQSSVPSKQPQPYPILAHMQLQRKPNRVETMDSRIFNMPVFNAPEINVRKSNALRRSLKALALAQDQTLRNSFSSEKVLDIANPGQLSNKLMALRRDSSESLQPLPVIESKEQLGSDKSLSNFKTLDLGHLRQPSVNLSNVRDRKQSKRSNGIFLAEQSRISEPWDSVNSSIPLKHADHAKALSSLSNKISRKQCGNTFLKPIYDGKEFVFRKLRRQQAKQSMLLNKEFERNGSRLPKIRKSSLENQQSDQKSLLEPKYSNLSGFIPVLDELYSSKQDQYFPPPPIDLPKRSIEDNDNVHLTYVNSTVQGLMESNQKGSSVDSYPKEKSGSKDFGVQTNTSMISNGNDYQQLFNITQTELNARKVTLRERKIRAKIRAQLPIAVTSRTSLGNDLAEAVHHTRRCESTINKDDALNIKSLQNQQEAHSNSVVSSSLQTLPQVSVSMIAVRTHTKVFQPQVKLEQRASSSGVSSQLHELPTSRRNSAVNQAYEFHQEMRRTDKVRQMSEMTRFQDESLKGVKILLQSNPKNSENDRQENQSPSRIVMGQKVLEPAHKTVPAFRISKLLLKKALAMQTYLNRDNNDTQRRDQNEVCVRPDGLLRLRTKDSFVSERSGGQEQTIFVNESPIVNNKFVLENERPTLLQSRERSQLIDINILPDKSDRNSSGLEFKNVKRLQTQVLPQEVPKIEEEFITQTNAIIELISSHEEGKSESKAIDQGSILQPQSVDYQDRTVPAHDDKILVDSILIQNEFDAKDPYSIQPKAVKVEPVSMFAKQTLKAKIRKELAKQGALNEDLKPLTWKRSPSQVIKPKQAYISPKVTPPRTEEVSISTPNLANTIGQGSSENLKFSKVGHKKIRQDRQSQNSDMFHRLDQGRLEQIYHSYTEGPKQTEESNHVRVNPINNTSDGVISGGQTVNDIWVARLAKQKNDEGPFLPNRLKKLSTKPKEQGVQLANYLFTPTFEILNQPQHKGALPAREEEKRPKPFERKKQAKPQVSQSLDLNWSEAVLGRNISLSQFDQTPQETNPGGVLQFDNKEKYRKGVRGVYLRKVEGRFLKNIISDQATAHFPERSYESVTSQQSASQVLNQSSAADMTNSFNKLSFQDTANMTLPKLNDRLFKVYEPGLTEKGALDEDSTGNIKDANIAVEVVVKGNQTGMTRKELKPKQTDLIAPPNLPKQVPRQQLNILRHKKSVSVQRVYQESSPNRFKVYEFSDNPQFTRQAGSTKKFQQPDSSYATKKDGFYSSGQFSKSSDTRLKAKFKGKGIYEEGEVDQRAKSLPRGPDIKVIGSKTATNYAEKQERQLIASNEVEMPADESQSLNLQSQTFVAINNLAGMNDGNTNSQRSHMSESKSTTKVLLTQALPSHRNAEYKPLIFKIVENDIIGDNQLNRPSMKAISDINQQGDKYEAMRSLLINNTSTENLAPQKDSAFDAPYNLTLEADHPLNADLNQVTAHQSYQKPVDQHSMLIRVISQVHPEQAYLQQYDDTKHQSKISFVQSESYGSKTTYSERLKSIQRVRAKVRRQIANQI